MDRTTRQSYRYCRQIARRRGRSIYFAFKRLSRSRKAAMDVLYAFMVTCLDEVDGYDPSDAAQVSQGLLELHAFNQTLAQVIDNPAQSASTFDGKSIWPALGHVMQTQALDGELLHTYVAGARFRLTHRRWQTFEELEHYIYCVAGVVGRLAASVCGGHDSTARKLAEYRASAMAMTMLLRDLASEARRQRIYLPVEDLTRFGVTPAMFEAEHQPDASFLRLMRFQIERVRSYYEMSQQLESHLPRASRAFGLATLRLGRTLLETLADDPGRVLFEQVQIPAGQRWRIALKARLRR